MRLNLTQHAATPEQQCSEPSRKEEVRRLLTFEALPEWEEILDRADALAEIARAECGPATESDWPEAMIGGAPYLMGPLERALRARSIHPVYAFSVRESVDQVQPDGSVRKVAVFRHTGFILADDP